MKKFLRFLKEVGPKTKVFLTEVKGEWKKVTRPARNEVVTTTIVVVVTSFVFSIYLWVSDYAIQNIYQWAFEQLGIG